MTEEKIGTGKKLLLFIILTLFFFLLLRAYFLTSGGYSREINLMYISPKDFPVSNVLNAAGHESGHYVYFNKLTQAQRNEYKQLFLDSNMYITDYAKTNEEEDFAEMFGHMGKCVLSPTYLKGQDVNKVRFFWKNIDDILK